MPKGQTAEQRFLSKCLHMESGCIEWQSTIHRDGYGKFWHKGKQIQAHRVAYELFKGGIPEGMWVLHHCDNRKCVNPDHLYAGTPKQNVLDKVRRYKGMWGAMKIPTAIVEKCREMYADGGMSQQEIANLFGISQTQVSRYVRRVSRVTI